MDRTESLKKLLNPERIAIIGASNSTEKAGGIIFRRLIESRRRLFPVNPKETVIQGYKVFQDIAGLPENIDLAVITVSAEASVTAVDQCIKKNIQNFIIVAGGFGETGEKGVLLENRLKKIAEENRINILGPNSLGIFLPDENIDTIFVEHGDKSLGQNGKVACIVQSGSVGVEALGYASNTGYGMRAFVGLGNKCDLDEIDFLQYFLQDKKTNCLGFYLENIEKGREFLDLAKKVAVHKPVVVLKAGRTETAAHAVSSHTGKLAGSDNVINGAFRQFGIQRVNDDEEFCDATKVLSMLPGAPGNRMAVLTAAGGYGVICTDYIENNQSSIPLKMAKLSDATKQKIREATFPFTACENPVDITASADDQMFSKSLDALIEDENVDMIICIAFFAPPGISENLIDIIARKSSRSPKPVIVFTKYGPFTDTSIRNLYHAGVAAYPSVSRAVRAARFLVERSMMISRLESRPDRQKEPGKENDSRQWMKSLENRNCPDEYDAKRLVSSYAISIPEGRRLLPGENLDLTGISPPYVLKVCSAHIMHKTELQGVILGNDAQSVEVNYEKMQKKFAGEPILVEHQTEFSPPEFIIGIINDPALGHAVMVGAGGILTEIYQDTCFRLAPCSVEDAMDMIDELVLSPVFNNFRGIRLDKMKLARTVSKVSRLAGDLGAHLNQLDINPIVFSQKDWIALDVKMILDQ